MVLIEGIALVILGILLLATPNMTTTVVVRFLGIYWLIAGIIEILSIFLDRSLWGWKLFIGVLGIIAGILIFQHPRWSTPFVGATLVIILGIEGLLIGGIRIYEAFRGAGLGSAIVGALSVLFGLILLLNVWVATLTLPWVLGILAIAGGILSIVMAFRLK
jgi:uncharacterized membrane protein HdeD (DUF308 family)